MSAAPAMPYVIPEAQAVAAGELPEYRPRPIDGFAFYRRHSAALLRRYLRASMELGRTPCLLGNMVFRGRVSSYRLTTFEDIVIFVLDVEKCLKRLDSSSQAIIAHVALEDYSVEEAAGITGDSHRSASRIYGEAMDRLTRLFLEFGLLDPNVENLSRDEA